MEADDHQDDEIKESMSDNEDDKDVKVRETVTTFDPVLIDGWEKWPVVVSRTW